MLYTLTHPFTREPIGLEAWICIGVEYYILYEMWLKFKPVTYCSLASDTMSRNQLNQKLKLMVEAPGSVIYSNILITVPHLS